MNLAAIARYTGVTIILAIGAVIPVAAAQTNDAVISAKGGAATFAATCSGCHGDAAVGGDHGPSLRGAPFWSQWEGKPMRKLYSRIISTMPQDNPGMLTEQQVLGVVAYLTLLNTGSTPQPAVKSANALNAMIVQPIKSSAPK